MARPSRAAQRPVRPPRKRSGPPATARPLRVQVLHGPNLNLLGTRDPAVYGTTTLAEIEASCAELVKAVGGILAFHQSNHEGQLVDWVQAARQTADAIVINPAA